MASITLEKLIQIRDGLDVAMRIAGDLLGTGVVARDHSLIMFAYIAAKVAVERAIANVPVEVTHDQG